MFKKAREKAFRNYELILSQQFPYFNGLTIDDKNKFLYRLHKFRRSKNFHLVNNLEDDPAIEVLVSAAAIQLTFGLEDFRFDYFDDIYVMRDAYTYGFSTAPYIGHVNSRGIYISWRHFREGYKTGNDRNNVGLHEMAHALEYEFAYGNYSEDDELKKKFDSVMRQVDGVLFHEGWKCTELYSQQGLQNKHECWAESIELFFENAAELKNHYPDLFTGICLLLMQQPAIC